MSEKVPSGVVGIFIDPDGRVIATATDFYKGYLGGFTLREAQTMRVKKALALEVANAFCSPVFVEAMSEYDIERVMQNMQKNGHKAVFLGIGEEGDLDA